MDDLLERILGEPAPEDEEETERVRAHVAELGELAADERFLAGIDESWFQSGRRGVVLTDRRIFRYRRDAAKEILALSEVENVRVRRIWYPAAGFLGKGEAWGHGPVIILRLRFELAGGGRARLRLQDCAGVLRPFITGLIHLVGPDRVTRARTLPGL